MKTSLSLLGIIALSTTFAACSEDTANPPGGTGGSGVPTQTGGAPGSGGDVVPGSGGDVVPGSGGDVVPGSGGDVTPGTGGTIAGTGSVSGTGGSEGGNSISIDGAWVDMTGNTVGIQGSFFILEDSVKDDALLDDGKPHSDVTADTGAVEEDGLSKFGDDTEAPCISGTGAQVMALADPTLECDSGASAGDVDECDWDAYWGAGIGLNLNETGGEDSVQYPFDAAAAGITGFQFTVSGSAPGATIRFKATDVPNDGEDFCAEIDISTPDIQVPLTELVHMCWGTAGTETLDVTQLQQLQWQIVTDPNGPIEITNFCIDNLAWY